MDFHKVLRFILISITVCNAERNEYSSNGKYVQQNSVHKFTGGYTGGVIPVAIQSRRSVEVRPVEIHSDPITPAVVLVDAGVIPLTILFRSSSSSLNVMQQHSPGEVGEQQFTKSEDEPHRLLHEVTKPIIQEVREFITPFRKVVQEIQPVQEDIQTIVARGEQITAGANKFGNRNSYGNPGVSSHGISFNNIGYNFNDLSERSHVDSENHVQVKPLPIDNYQENKPNSFGNPWMSSFNFPASKTTNLGFNEKVNFSKKSSFGNVNQFSGHINHPADPIAKALVNYHTQKEKKVDDLVATDEKQMVSIEPKSTTSQKTPSRAIQKADQKKPNIISKTNQRSNNKADGSKKPFTSPVKNLREKSLHKQIAKN